MHLQRISVPLKNIANVSKRNGNALQNTLNALKMHRNEKRLNAIFFNPAFPKQGHICYAMVGSKYYKQACCAM